MLLGRIRTNPAPCRATVLYRSTKLVMRRALPVGVAVVVLLLSARCAVPRGEVGLSRRPGAAAIPRRRTRSATSCATTSSTTPRRRSTVVIPDTCRAEPLGDLDRYAADCRGVADVSTVSPPTEVRRQRLPDRHTAPRRCSRTARAASVGSDCTRCPPPGGEPRAAHRNRAESTATACTPSRHGCRWCSA